VIGQALEVEGNGRVRDQCPGAQVTRRGRRSRTTFLYGPVWSLLRRGQAENYIKAWKTVGSAIHSVRCYH
jgi:hypothetical protein